MCIYVPGGMQTSLIDTVGLLPLALLTPSSPLPLPNVACSTSGLRLNQSDTVMELKVERILPALAQSPRIADQISSLII